MCLYSDNYHNIHLDNNMFSIFQNSHLRIRQFSIALLVDRFLD